MLEVLEENDPKIPEYLDVLGKSKLNFGNIKAVVYTRDIDLIVKKKDNFPMVGNKDECMDFMMGKFAINPKAPITMRDVTMVTMDGKILFGGITI